MKNLSEILVLLGLFGLLVAQQASAQAPGDAQDICSVLAPRPPPPDDWHLLMDSHNYRNLLLASGSVWETRNFDGTGNGFRHGSNSLCGQSVRVCDFSFGASQNNWVFTQHISYDSAREVRIEVSYTLAECQAQSACTTNFVTLHRYDIDQPNSAEQVNTNNYMEFARLDYPPGNSILTTTVRFTRPNAWSGFYLGIRDTGTCGSVNQLQVHYLVCPSNAVHLVRYPEVALPPEGVTSPTVDEATCVANATLDVGESSVIRAFHDGQCEFDVSCRCLEGYEENPPRAQNGGTVPAICQACTAGFYRSSLDEVCTACPTNTDQSGAAAPFCPCISGFFRAAGEDVGFDCTAPPTAVRNLRVVPSRTRQDEVTVRWDVPEVTGRPDFYYTISRSIPGSIGDFLTFEDRLVDADSTVTLRVANLAPFTDYIIRVAVHNGVTPNDSDNDQLRITQVTARTAEGTPGPPSSVQPLCTVVVWGTPAMPNGVITGYELDLGGLSVTAPSGANFIIVENDMRNERTSVRVRARTATGPGDWSRQCNLGCGDNAESACTEPTDPTEPGSLIQVSNIVFNIIRADVSEELEGVDLVELRLIDIISGTEFVTQADLLETNLIMIPPDTPLEKGSFYSIEVRPLYSDGSTGLWSGPLRFQFQGFELDLRTPVQCSSGATELAIAVVVTFAGTALVVAVLVSIIACLCVHRKKKQKEQTLNGGTTNKLYDLKDSFRKTKT